MEEQNKCNTPNILDFGEPHKENCIIKVIGVGGGGGNAVNHMYKEGIHDVSFVLCNTDAQALNDSPVPVHLQLGKEGLGAGNKPAKAREAAEESLESVRKMLNDGTKMAFITAGMGGGSMSTPCSSSTTSVCVPSTPSSPCSMPSARPTTP